MSRPNEDLERVARWLDGEAIELTADQRALADELAADEAPVAVALDVEVPPGALHRVHARLRRSRRAGRWVRVRVAVAAAAAVVVGVGLLWLAPQAPAPAGPVPFETYLAEMARDPAPDLQAEVEALEMEIAQTRAQVVAGGPSEVTVALAKLAEDIRSCLVEDPQDEDEAIWRQWVDNL